MFRRKIAGPMSVMVITVVVWCTLISCTTSTGIVLGFQHHHNHLTSSAKKKYVSKRSSARGDNGLRGVGGLIHAVLPSPSSSTSSSASLRTTRDSCSGDGGRAERRKNLAFFSPSKHRRLTVLPATKDNNINGKEDEGGARDGKTTMTTTLATLDQEGDGGSGSTSGSTGFNSGYMTETEYSAFVYSPRRKRRLVNLQKQMLKEAKQQDVERIEDGYEAMMGEKKRPFWKRIILKPFKVAKKISKGIPEPGTLILVRHGESGWNANKTFTGWADPDLSEVGYREVEYAARLMLAGGYKIDVVFTSRLKRAIRSTWILLQEMSQTYLPVFKSWRLNERNYGALTGLSKTETANQLGAELVQTWRGSLKSQPPSLTPSHPYWPGRDRKYSDLTSSQVPTTESLLDCMERTVPVWLNRIQYELRMGRNVLVVAHANTLRGLVKIIDDVGDDEIQEVAIPTGIPIVYKFDKEMKPVRPSGDRQTANFQRHMSGMFLEKPGLLKEALAQEEEWRGSVPGYEDAMSKTKTPMSPLERSLTKLKAVRELGTWAGQFVEVNGNSVQEEDDGSDGNMGKPIDFLTEDEVWELGIHELEEGKAFDPEITYHADDGRGRQGSEEEEDSVAVFTPNLITNNTPCITAVPSGSVVPGIADVPIRKDSVVVLIRHGKTEHNKLGLFTGWEDAPLAPEGKDEAREAGRLLKMHGFEFDVVYTSWLSRAIETAWLVMDEMDALWLPIIKTWRLNERMYGALTGLSKQMVAQQYGQKQFKAWRRGYNVQPPKVSSFSLDYPGNDVRYKYINDIRVSLSETLMRSFDSGKIKIHRKLPKAESLKNCMDRTIPYYTNSILPEAISEGKRVLISSSENAIRGLLMHLCEIPEEKVVGLEIPNGLPIIFDIQSKCVKLLDDGSGIDPLEKYNFGEAAGYLFRPCQNEDGSPDEECDIRYMSDAMLRQLSNSAKDSKEQGEPSSLSKEKIQVEA